jgi:hypothetical protein
MINNRFYPLLVLALVFFAHAPSLNSGFHYDDQHSLLDNPHIRDLGNLPRFFIDPTAFPAHPEFAMHRPLVFGAPLSATGIERAPQVHSPHNWLPSARR